MKHVKLLNRSQLTAHSSQKDIIQVLLENRGVKSKKETESFLNPKLEDVTYDAVGIDSEQIKKSLTLIKKTIKEKKAIVIYGDYDVDGICGTAILWETIYSFYKNVHPYIPHRIDEGYGLSIQGIENSKKKIENIGLIITVDNGIVAHKAIEYARKEKIKIIITDHHVKGSKFPKADAIVHTTELCGAGVAYLFSQDIKNKILNIKNSNEEHLELVALATIADLVPLNKHNRTLVKFGIEKLRKTTRPGLLELFREARLDPKKIGVYEIGHMIAPRLNASGRISHAMDSLRLICTTDKNRAKKLTEELGQINKERQKLTLESAVDAITRVQGSETRAQNLIFVESEEYEQGVIGLIASRLVEEFYRPAIVVSLGKEASKGSARSIRGVNIIELIRSSSDFLSGAGGHPMAAGFSLETKNLELFKKAIIKNSKKIDKKLFERILKVDLELPFELISPKLFSEVQKLAPFGMGNPEPVFITHGVSIVGTRSVGVDGQHLKLVLEKDGCVFTAIYFRAGDKRSLRAYALNGFKIGDLVDIVYTINENEWNDKKSIELKIKNIEINNLSKV